MSELSKIKQAIIDLEIDEIRDLVSEALDAGVNPKSILDAATEGMNEVGRLYEEKEYYLTELVLAGETIKEAFSVLEPALKGEETQKKKGVIVLATVKGDQHDIGKNILLSLLMSKGYEIHDLGMDVDTAKIVKVAKEVKAQVVGLSTLLTMTIEQMKEVIEALKREGIRDNLKVIVGGAPLNMELAKKLGADAYADDATDGVKEIERLIDSFQQ
ncbi:MAG: cobalamin B12-binding domain-containing protein [Promethearchaeota archaeon]